MSSLETKTRCIRQLVVKDAANNDFRFRILLKMHHSAQKISKNFSDLRRERCAPQVLFFVPPHFSDKSYVPDRNVYSQEMQKYKTHEI